MGEDSENGWHELVIYRLGEQDKNIGAIQKRIDDVNKVREGQHTENQVAFANLQNALKNLTDKVVETENLKKWMITATGLALLTAVFNVILAK